MHFSEEFQEPIFEEIVNPQVPYQSLVIEAAAGSGKTTTIVEATRRLSQRYGILMLAFNKSIADELKKRVPGYVKVMTFHACGFAAFGRANPDRRPIVDGNKVGDLIWKDDSTIFPNEKFQHIYGPLTRRLVGLAKSGGFRAPVDPAVYEQPGAMCNGTDKEYAELIDYHDFMLPDNANVEELISYTRSALAASYLKRDVLDFDDMLYYALVDGYRFYENDFVFIDEAQDTNRVQRALLERMLKWSVRLNQITGRLVAVGDKHQSLYAFRGAASDAMERIIEEFNAKVMPLSISYRCPRLVVEAARTHMDIFHKGKADLDRIIQAAPDAPDGEVTGLDTWSVKDFGPHDFILCRNVAPLISAAYWFIRRRVPVKVLGRDIGEGLIALIKKLRPKDLTDLESKVALWMEREIGKLKKSDEGKTHLIQDKGDSIVALMDAVGLDASVEDLIKSIRELFAEGNGCLRMATVHKAKGLEADTVFILDRAKLMPSKWAKKKHWRQQEANIEYVAITRAKRRLIDITSEGARDSEEAA